MGVVEEEKDVNISSAKVDRNINKFAYPEQINIPR